ncbi:MAG: DUF4931 domain-containing protein [Thermoanaerobaculia bacterium]|nr:DUF4931 domain-containing protein [Thermoanaerobaculia bacterium]
MGNRIDRHPLTRETVLVTPNRLERPNAIIDRERSEICPFCPGNEHETPPEIDRVESGDGDWLVRVVPNKYPIASPDLDLEGVHEVIVESRHHDDELSTMEPDHVRTLVEVWLERIDRASSVESVETVILFRNRGIHAGESIRHPHTQLLGVPFIPDRIASQRTSLDACILCRGNTHLTIHTSPSFSLRAAPVSRFPHQLWIVPHSHEPSPRPVWSAQKDLASMIQLAEAILFDELGTISMNWAIIQAPVGEVDFHWYMELSPRITGIAGLEIATGTYVNLIPPEESARRLKLRLEKRT